MDKKKVIIIGATGKLGRLILKEIDLVRESGSKVEIYALGGGANIEKLKVVCERYKPSFVIIPEDATPKNSSLNFIRYKEAAQVLFKGKINCEDMILISAAKGLAGMEIIAEGIERGAKIIVASKEILVSALPLLVDYTRKSKGKIIPLDSELTALHHLVHHCDKNKIKRVFLPASGGPFIGRDERTLSDVSVKEALAHPLWKMGEKISIDSATLLNKAFERIAASGLFGFDLEQISIFIHREGMVHAIVETDEGKLFGAFAKPNMRVAIKSSLELPQHDTVYKIKQIKSLLMYQSADIPEFGKTGLKLADAAVAMGARGAIALASADEVAVTAFLDGRISFLKVTEVIKETLEALEKEINRNYPTTVGEVIRFYKEVKTYCEKAINNKIINER